MDMSPRNYFSQNNRRKISKKKEKKTSDRLSDNFLMNLNL